MDYEEGDGIATTFYPPFIIRAGHEADDFQDIWDFIDKNGVEVAPRGKVTKEINCATIQIEPNADILHIKTIEGTPLVKDKKFADMRVDYALKAAHFSVYQMIELLKTDVSTRRAITFDYDYHPYNIACVNSVQALRRDGSLQMVANLRSSDTVGVLPMDIYMVQKLQDHILAQVNEKQEKVFNLDEGNITFFAASAHKYI